MELELWVGPEGVPDLSWLAAVGANDIQVLHLRYQGLTDDRIGCLRHLTGLKYLDLSHTPITDTSLLLLATLGELRLLDLSEDTRTTSAGRDAMRQAVPGLDIIAW
jgi:hypothetical protein